MTMIYQRTPHDCAICTIAMATDRSYENVHAVAELYGDFHPDVGCKSEWRVLEELGYVQMETFRIMNRGVLAPEFFLHFSWKRRAILAVPSLNVAGGFHSVYWDGDALWDPCTQRIYEKWEDLRPEDMLVFA